MNSEIQIRETQLLLCCLNRTPITPVLTSLHWLPVCVGVDFRLLLLVSEELNGFRPKYISDLLLCYEPSRPLRSSGTGLLPRVRTKHG